MFFNHFEDCLQSIQDLIKSDLINIKLIQKRSLNKAV